MKQREDKILKLLVSNKQLSVSELANHTGVSQVTVRKDLDHLEDEKMIVREHGYARLNDSDDMAMRLVQNYSTKRSIATRALEEVKDGETVMIESGSCCAILAREIAEKRENVTIITNSAFIADYVRDFDVEIILLGGNYQNESQVNVGPMTRQCLESFFVDKLFVGIDGYTPEHGFTGNDYLRSQVVRDMSERADETIAISDSSKFGHRSEVALLPIANIAEVITDSEIPDDCAEALEEAGVKVIAVSEDLES